MKQDAFKSMCQGQRGQRSQEVKVKGQGQRSRHVKEKAGGLMPTQGWKLQMFFYMSFGQALKIITCPKSFPPFRWVNMFFYTFFKVIVQLDRYQNVLADSVVKFCKF